jgi:hypothetical protein
MMKILGLLNDLMQAIKEWLLNMVGTGTTTPTVYSVPVIINNDASRPCASFLFKSVHSRRSTVDGRSATEDSFAGGIVFLTEKTDLPVIINNDGPQTGNRQPETNEQHSIPRANDELAQKPGRKSDGPRWLVNDDLAACSSIVNGQLKFAGSRLTTHNSRLATRSSRLIAELIVYIFFPGKSSKNILKPVIVRA